LKAILSAAADRCRHGRSHLDAFVTRKSFELIYIFISSVALLGL
jgi:hypothetical protein